MEYSHTIYENWSSEFIEFASYLNLWPGLLRNVPVKIHDFKDFKDFKRDIWLAGSTATSQSEAML